ncbi:MAG: M4 family metallopeptidase [Bacteroidales bacterium]|nr:M4 family metallopeptidase [Bacteroidales bacterium]
MRVFFSVLILVFSMQAFSQHFENIRVHNQNEISIVPTFFSIDQNVSTETFATWFNKEFSFEIDYDIIGTEKDQLGMIHYRCQQKINGHPLHNGIFILHTKNNLVQSVNGNIFSDAAIINSDALNESTALDFALESIDADQYKWQIPEEEELIKYIENNENATYYPKGVKVLIPSSEKETDFILCWKFNIYAHAPMSRQEVFVNTQNGEIVKALNLIHVTDVPGTAVTAYSGTKNIVADSYSGSYRLRETGRGGGIETYDMNQGTNYGNAVDFSDTDNNWNNVNTQQDEYAGDAHFATESTYDYYYNNFGRNSINDNGLKLISYIHYDVDYTNAFWNGSYMTYGDGGGSYSPLTTLDISGHEITHGLTSYTANLDYQNESGGMNEGFSDIFGTMVEFYGDPASADWLIGEDIGSAFRSLSNPNSYGLPDTYLGNNWVASVTTPTQANDYGGVHTNGGVLMYWFYLVSEGGSGTNDNGDSYNITGLGKSNAAAIAYRLLTVYLTNSSDYADARTYAIQSAVDLFGACTSEVGVVTNAMYAVGIGVPYVPTVLADFDANYTTFCEAPATVDFTNSSVNASTFNWDFGDGATSTSSNPSHTYNTFGDYTVKLYADGGSCGTDSLIETQYISVQSSNPCIYVLGITTGSSENGCSGILYDSGGDGNYQDNTDYSVTIQPAGADDITLTFNSFDFESGYDYLYIYDGPSTASSQVSGSPFDGTSLPGGGSITSSGSSITIRQTTDQGLTRSGFELEWLANYSGGSMAANFSANTTSTCTGEVQFMDSTTHCPFAWTWDFGDGNTSSQSNPWHYYAANGTYTVKLIVSSASGTDSIIKTNYITVALPPAPSGTGDQQCGPASLTLSANGAGVLSWYDLPTGGSLLDTGSTFITGTLNSTTIYYVEDNIEGTPYYGASTSSNSNGDYFPNAYVHYLEFDVSKKIVLKSVEVNAGSAGDRVIELQNSSGITLESSTINIPLGISRIDLDYIIDAGTGYRLVGPLSPNLYRNNSNCNYPYSVGNSVSITKSSAGTDPYGFYYYFYDWEVAEFCTSARTAVAATIDPSPTALFSAIETGYNVDFTDLSSNVDSWHWDFGDGDTSNLQNPSHLYTAPASYIVTLTSYNECGSNQHAETLNIMNVGIEETENIAIELYPNPSNGFINVAFMSEANTQYNLVIHNALGQKIFSEALNGNGQIIVLEKDFSSFATGMYYLMMQSEKESVVKTFSIK